ncbi:MAG TPA: hypothetical protein VJT14_07765, partial [Candidatus Dormibacteraeota bacterium]|nr:hypothetical protein [Candidatus Dormibacteraeota bacterium]
MGCACLRGDGHCRPHRGAGRLATRRRQQGGVAHQPDPAGPHARSQLLRRRGDADTVHLSDREGQPDANSDPNAVADSVVIGQPIGDRDRQRVTHAMSIAVGDGDAITVTEWERETVGLALGP